MLPRLRCCCTKEEAGAGAELVTSLKTPQVLGLTLEDGSEEADSIQGLEAPPPDHAEEGLANTGLASAALGSAGVGSAALSGQRPSRPSVGSSMKLSSKPRISMTLSFEDEKILRGTSVRNVMRKRAQIMQDNKGGEETYLMSRSVEMIDVFISHNWVVPRRKKFWALALYFNVGMALAASYVGVALGYLLDTQSVPPALHNVDLVMRPYCFIFGSCTFFLALMKGQDVPIVGKLFSRQRLFLDKVCINQSDPALKAAGIKSLGAFLSHSSKMLVLFHSAYVQKLWTVYEMACFMYLHDEDRLQLLPVDIARVVWQSTATVTTISGFNMIAVHFGSVLGIGNMVRTLSFGLTGLVCITGLSFILRNWALQQSELFSSLRTFQLAKAGCFDESDRPVVNANICSFVRAMGLAQAGEGDDDVLLYFDRLVQENLPGLLRSTVGRTGLPYKYAVLAGTATGYYMLDLILSQQDASATFVLAWLMHGFTIQAVMIPSAFLVCGWAANKCPPLGARAELALKVGVSLLATVVVVLVFWVSSFLRDKAVLTSWWLLPYASSSALQALTLAKLF